MFQPSVPYGWRIICPWAEKICVELPISVKFLSMFLTVVSKVQAMYQGQVITKVFLCIVMPLLTKNLLLKIKHIKQNFGTGKLCSCFICLWVRYKKLYLCYWQKNKKMAAVYTCGLFDSYWVNSCEIAKINKNIYDSLWINSNLNLQYHTTGQVKQILTGERLRYLLSASILRTEYVVPLGNWEEKDLSVTLNIAL